MITISEYTIPENRLTRSFAVTGMNSQAGHYMELAFFSIKWPYPNYAFIIEDGTHTYPEGWDFDPADEVYFGGKNYDALGEVLEVLGFGDLSPDWPIVLPKKPTISSFSRNGNSGSATISEVNDDDDVYAYALDMWSDLAPQLVQIGHRVGSGIMDLDFSVFKFVFFEFEAYLMAPVIFQAENGIYYSELSDFTDPDAIVSNPLSVSGFSHSEDTAVFTLAGLPAGNKCALLYYDPETQNFKSISYTSNGLKTITGLMTFWKYNFILFYFASTGQLALPLGFGDQESVPGSGTDFLEQLELVLKTIQGMGSLVFRQPKWDPEDLPAFDAKAIIIAPDQSGYELRTVREKQEMFSVSIRCLVKSWLDPEAEEDLIALKDAVIARLNGERFEDKIEIGGDEFEGDLEYETVNEVYLCARIIFRARMPSFVI